MPFYYFRCPSCSRVVELHKPPGSRAVAIPCPRARCQVSRCEPVQQKPRVVPTRPHVNSLLKPPLPPEPPLPAGRYLAPFSTH